MRRITIRRVYRVRHVRVYRPAPRRRPDWLRLLEIALKVWPLVAAPLTAWLIEAWKVLAELVDQLV